MIALVMAADGKRETLNTKAKPKHRTPNQTPTPLLRCHGRIASFEH
jgi:hypothetical protein